MRQLTGNRNMKIVHETSPRIAVDVVRTLRLIGGPIQADDGLSARLVNHPNGPYLLCELDSFGAFLEFEWTGKVVRSSGNYWAPNLLHDQHPLRAFVPAGTDDHLYLVGIRFRATHGWADALLLPQARLCKPVSWIDWVAGRLPDWKQREAARIAEEVSRIIKEKPKVQVIFSRIAIR